jgi:lipoate-protein ligase A
MAIDEATLEWAIQSPDSLPTLRWYQWSIPTLSLGYFQSAASVPEPLADLPLVRRLTGGGAILHDCELTYSIVFPSGCWPKESFLDHVADVHDEIRLATRGLTFAGKESHEAAVEPFLCFERRSSLDLVNHAQKIVGSAQRKRTGALLQHGSILLGTSSLTPHLAAAEGANESMIEKIACDVTQGLLKRWNLDPISIERTTQEIQQANELADSKYRCATWNRRR